MNRKSLGLLALLLLNLAAEASVSSFALDNVPSADDTTLDLAELAYPPYVNQSQEWSVQPFRGFLVPHHYDMMAMYKHVSGFSFRYRAAMRQAEGIGEYRDKLTYGFTLNVMDLGSDVAGYGIGSGAMLMAQSGRNGYFLFSMGLGYLTQKFDAINNPRNVAIGSRMNGTMQLGHHWELASWPGKKSPETQTIEHLWKINLELGMLHFSNANWSQPNFGINIPYASVGLKKALVHSYLRSYNDKQRLGVHRTEISDLRECPNRGWKHSSTYGEVKVPNVPLWSHSVGFRMGRRQIELDQRVTFTNLLLDYVAEHATPKIGQFWRYGVNVFFDKSYTYTKFGMASDAIRLSSFTEVALTFGHRWQFGRWGILADAGFYLYRPKDLKRAYYEGVGLSYRVISKLQAIARLKAHLSSADYMEWGLAYRL
jgi:hypothetical protein